MRSVTGSTYSIPRTLAVPDITKNLSADLIAEITRALHQVGGYGSIEIYMQGHAVTQITVRSIRKTKHILAE